MAITTRKPEQVPLLAWGEPAPLLEKCAATAVVNAKGRIISKGKKMTRLHLKIEGCSFMIAASQQGCCMGCNYRLFQELPAPLPENLFLGVASMVKRLRLPKKVIQKAPFDTLRTLVRDRILYTKGMQPQDELDEKDQGPLARMVQIARKEDRDICLPAEIIPVPSSTYISRTGFAAVEVVDNQRKPIVLGKGQHATVIQATHVSSNNPIALRFHRLSELDGSDRMRKIAATLSGKPGVLPTLAVLGFLNLYGEPTAVSAHPIVPNTCRQIIQRKVPLSQEERNRIGYHVLQGLNTFAQMQATHRDIALENVLCIQDKEGWSAYIGDYFGLFHFPGEQSFRWGRGVSAEAPSLARDVLDAGNVLFYVLQEPKNGKIVAPPWHTSQYDVYTADYEAQEKWAKRRIPPEKVFSQDNLAKAMQSAQFPNEIRLMIWGMLNPDPATRWTAEKCLSYFEMDVLKLKGNERSSD